MHPWFFCLLIFLLPFLIFCSSGQQLLPLNPLSLVSYLCPASLSPVSFFWLKGRSRWDLWSYTALTWHTMIPMIMICVCSICVTLPWHWCKVEVKLAMPAVIFDPNKSHMLSDLSAFICDIQIVCTLLSFFVLLTILTGIYFSHSVSINIKIELAKTEIFVPWMWCIQWSSSIKDLLAKRQ